MRDAALVGAGELIGRARSRQPCRTVVLIAVIKAVILPVAAPSCRHTVLVGTGECSRGASGVWGKKEMIQLKKCQFEGLEFEGS